VAGLIRIGWGPFCKSAFFGVLGVQNGTLQKHPKNPEIDKIDCLVFFGKIDKIDFLIAKFEKLFYFRKFLKKILKSKKILKKIFIILFFEKKFYKKLFR
jgi:hypothetical protein